MEGRANSQSTDIILRDLCVCVNAMGMYMWGAGATFSSDLLRAVRQPGAGVSVSRRSTPLCPSALLRARTPSAMSCRPPRSTVPPFGTWDNLPAANQTTYGTAFMKYDLIPVTAIRPKEQHPWKTVAKFDTRSTAQDAFQDMGANVMRESYKPIREYEPVAWPQKLITTNQAMFVGNHGFVKRKPFRPKLRDIDHSKFDTRSTQQESFLPIPETYRPRPPIRPASLPYEYTKFENTSTSRAAFIAHPVSPYVAAKKPPPSMGQDGVMA